MTDKPTSELDRPSDEELPEPSNEELGELSDEELDRLSHEELAELSEDARDLDDTESEERDPLTFSVRNMALLVVLGVVMLAGGLAYVGWAGGRTLDNLEERESRAQVAIREFEQSQVTSLPANDADLADESDSEDEEPADTATDPVGPAPQPGEVLVVNRVPGADYGRMAIRHSDGSRTMIEQNCVRIAVAADRGVCLRDDGGVVPSFSTVFFDTANPAVTLKSYASALPSRVRLSPNGQFSAVTAFISGASYEDIGADSTTIVTFDEVDSSERIRSIQQFEVTETNGEAKYANFAAQYWGVTFADTNEFYITGFFGETPEIMSGSLDNMTVSPTGWEGSCPSLSPDGKTLVFKELRSDGGFDLVAVDLETQNKWTLNESRSADDQVEWLDNDTILYALHPDGSDESIQPEFDIWMIDIAEGSEPELFLPNADSPAVVR